MEPYIEKHDTAERLLHETLTANAEAVLRLAQHAFDPERVERLHNLLTELKDRYKVPDSNEPGNT